MVEHISPPRPGGTSGLTVTELLALPLLRDSTVLAGARGVGRAVDRVNVMEVPDIGSWVRPHELLLTTGYPLLQHDDEALARWVAQLDDYGVAGVAFKLGRYFAELPAAALREADRRGLPIFTLHARLSFDEVITQVLTEVMNHRAETLARAETVMHDLVEVVIAGGGVEDVCEGLVRHLAQEAVITTMDGRVVARAGSDLAPLADLLGFDPTGRFCVESELPGAAQPAGGRSRLVVRIVGGRADLGRLVLLRDAPFSAQDEHVAAQAGTAAALALSKQQAIDTIEGKYRGDFLRDAILGRAGDPERVATHAASLGWDLRRPLAVVVAEVESEDVDENPLHTRADRFRRAWEGAVAAEDDRAALAGFSREVVVFLGVREDATPAEVTGRVVDLAGQVHGRGGGGRRTFVTGISRTITDLGHLPRAYGEARKAVQVGRRLHGDRAVTHFDGLGVYRLLSLVDNPEEIEAFIDETLGSLATDESEDAEDLRTTLSVLLDNNLNVASTARTLHFHYNSLRYRIGKLERMLGPFTTDPQRRFAIMLALHARQLDQL